MTVGTDSLLGDMPLEGGSQRWQVQVVNVLNWPLVGRSIAPDDPTDSPARHLILLPYSL